MGEELDPKDYFSENPGAYLRYRPRYPDALFEHLASLCKERRRAWDCAAGTGQATVPLSHWFDEVLGSDLSASQIAIAERRDNIRYRVGTSESMTLDEGSLDLIVVAQALHWLHRDRFFAQVRRALKPSGVFAAWCYGLFTTDPGVTAVVRRLFHDIIEGPGLALQAAIAARRRFLDLSGAVLR